MSEKKETSSEILHHKVLEKIKIIQSLPDEIAERFLGSKGMLQKTDFRKRVESSENKN